MLAWIAAAVAAVVYLPSLQEAGDETSLVGLVPKNAEALAAGVRSSELFDVPVITHTAVVQRDPDGLSRAALERVARRAERVSDGEVGELREIEGALPIVNARGLVPGSRESGTTAITYLFFDPTKTDLDDQDELARAVRRQVRRCRTTRLVGRDRRRPGADGGVAADRPRASRGSPPPRSPRSRSSSGSTSARRSRRS